MVMVCKKCKVRACKGDGKHFFRFPKNESLRQKWCEALGMDIAMIAPSNRLCSDHFRKDAISYCDERFTLKKGACPVVYVPLDQRIGPTTKKKKEKSRKIANKTRTTDLSWVLDVVGVCKVCRVQQSENKHLFRFPEDLALKKKWCSILGLRIESISSESQLCSDHFSDDAFLDETRSILSNNACPVPHESQNQSILVVNNGNNRVPNTNVNSLMQMLVIEHTANNSNQDVINTTGDLNSNQSKFERTHDDQSKTKQPNEGTDSKDEIVLLLPPPKPAENQPTQDEASENDRKEEIIVIVPLPPMMSTPGPVDSSPPQEDAVQPLKKIGRPVTKKRFEKRLAEKKKKIHKLQCRLRNRDVTIERLKKTIGELKDAPKPVKPETQEPAILKEIVDRCRKRLEMNNDSSKSYSKEVTTFASTLHFLSPAAYEFVRDSFMKQLPNTSTLKSLRRKEQQAAGKLDPTQKEEESESKKTLLFIELYKNYPILWSRRYPERKNKEEIEKAWISLQQQYDPSSSVLALKKKKSYLMVQYLQSVRNIKAGNPLKPWYAFKAMDSFLKRSGLTDEDDVALNDTEEMDNAIEDEDMDVYAGTVEYLEEEEEHAPVDEADPTIQFMVNDNVSYQFPGVNTTTWHVENQTSDVTMATNYEPSYNITYTSQQQKASQPNQEEVQQDQWSTFGQLVATQLKQIQCCDNRARVKSRINCIIKKAREKNLMNMQRKKQKNRIKKIRDRAREKTVREMKQISPNNINLARSKVNNLVQEALLKEIRQSEIRPTVGSLDSYFRIVL